MKNRVLVVEDNDVNRELFKDILEMNSYEVFLAEDGEAGIQMAREHKPDLILMDIQLPKIDGIQAAKILKADDSTKDIPIVALTAFAMKGDEEIFLTAGCKGHITKPISVADFMKAVETYLNA